MSDRNVGGHYVPGSEAGTQRAQELERRQFEEQQRRQRRELEQFEQRQREADERRRQERANEERARESRRRQKEQKERERRSPFSNTKAPQMEQQAAVGASEFSWLVFLAVGIISFFYLKLHNQVTLGADLVMSGIAGGIVGALWLKLLKFAVGLALLIGIIFAILYLLNH